MSEIAKSLTRSGATSRPQRRRRTWRRFVGFVIATVIVGVLGASPLTEDTEAAWVDSQQATASVSAITVGSPDLQACDVDAPLIIGLRAITISWLDSGEPNLQYVVGGADDEVFSPIAGAIPEINGTVWQVTLSRANGLLPLLLDILSGLLGSSGYLAVVGVHDSGWSGQPSRALVETGLINIGARCTIE